MESRVQSQDIEMREFGLNEDLSFIPTPTEVHQALLAAEKARPYVYTIPGYDDKAIRFLVMGCQGSGTQSQEDAAILMDQVAATSDPRPLFILFLGDNLYDYGARTPIDKEFSNYFYAMYTGEKFKNLSPLAVFLVLGNHDGNYHRKSFLSKNPVGRDTEIQQIARTYLPDATYKSVEEKERLYQSKYLDLKKMPKWNMPHFYYSIIIGNTQIFLLNSNSYAKDYLALISKNEDQISPLDNQAKWFKEEYDIAKSHGRQIIVAQHHPLYTPGKRAFAMHYDSHFYLSQDEINTLNKALHTNTGSYNELLKQIRIAQHIHADLDLVAHDHCMGFYNNAFDPEEAFNICQLTAGGGGQDLQDRESFLKHPYVACHLKQNGCASVLADPKHPNKLEVDIFTTLGHHLKFSNKNHYPLTQNHADPYLEIFRNTVLAICADYFEMWKQEERKLRHDELHPDVNKKSENNAVSAYFQSSLSMFNSGFSRLKQSIYHDKNKQNETILIHDLLAFLNQPVLPDLVNCIKYVDEVCKNLPNKEGSHSFYHSLTSRLMNKNKLWNKFGISLEQLNSNAPPSLNYVK